MAAFSLSASGISRRRLASGSQGYLASTRRMKSPALVTLGWPGETLRKMTSDILRSPRRQTVRRVTRLPPAEEASMVTVWPPPRLSWRVPGSSMRAARTPSDVLAKLNEEVQTVAEKIGADKTGFRLIVNNGEHAGQIVFHLHFHLMSGKKLPGF